jgi:hypothetical protein
VNLKQPIIKLFLCVNYEVFSHVFFEDDGVELLHAVVDEGEHGGAGLEPESIDETLAWLETSRERHIELLSFLA